MRLWDRAVAGYNAFRTYQAAPPDAGKRVRDALSAPPPAAPSPERDAFTRAVTDDQGFLLPAYRTFSALLYNTAARMYSSRWDEAVQHSIQNARAMENDAYFSALLDERFFPLTRWQWEVEADPDEVPASAAEADERERVRRTLEACVKKTPGLHQLRLYTGRGAGWKGRYAAQLDWQQRPVAGEKRWVVAAHDPVDGDKIHHDWDGTPGVMVYGGDRTRYADRGYRVETFDSFGPALLLDRPELRRRFLVHKHVVEDAAYLEPQSAARRFGVGLRSYAYWSWWLRDEMLSWLVSFMEKVGNMGLLIFYYEEGNEASRQRARASAEETKGQSALAVPVPKGKDAKTAGVELIPANVSGATFLKEIVGDYFERHIERKFVGQSLTGGDGGGDSLGGEGKSNLAADTKFNLLCFDAENQAETFTADLITPLRDLNFPGCPWTFRWKYVLPDPRAKDRLSAYAGLKDMLPVRTADLYADLGYKKPDAGDETVGGPQANPQQPGGPGDGQQPPAGPAGPPALPGGGPAPQPSGDSGSLPDAGGGAGGEPVPGVESASGTRFEPVPGMAELVVAMHEAAAAGDWQAVDALAEIGSDQDGLAGLADDLESPAGGFVTYQADAGKPRRKFASTQVDINASASSRLLTLARSIPDDELGEDGREHNAHVTVKYGLHTERPSDVYRAVGSFGPVSGRLTRLSAFRAADTGKDYDVLFCEVDSPDLHRLNARVAESLECTDTWPEYHPHATVAYLKPGAADKYVAAAGDWDIPFTADRITFSDQNRDSWTIMLVGQQTFPERYQAPAGVVTYAWQPAQTRSGKVKAVWSEGGRKPLYGKRAEAALARQGKAGDEPEANKPRGAAADAVTVRQGREPARQTARDVYAKAAADPASVRPEDLPALADHLHTLTRDELRAAVKSLEQRTGGKLKRELVDALLKHVGGDQSASGTRPVGQPAGAKPGKPRKREPKWTMAAVVRRSGGIDPSSFDFIRNFSGVKEAVEFGIPLGIFRKGGNKLDELAQSLAVSGDALDAGYGGKMASGHYVVPDGVNPSAHLLELIRDGVVSLQAQAGADFAAAEEAYYRELADARGHAEEPEIAEALRGGEAAGVLQEEKGATGPGGVWPDDADRGDEVRPDGSDDSDDSFDFGENVRPAEVPVGKRSVPVDELLAEQDAGPKGQTDLFGRPVPKTFPAKGGTQLSIEDAAREAWGRKAEEWAADKGQKVEARESGGRFKAGGQWYQVGKAEDGYPVTPVTGSAPTRTGQQVSSSPALRDALESAAFNVSHPDKPGHGPTPDDLPELVAHSPKARRDVATQLAAAWRDMHENPEGYTDADRAGMEAAMRGYVPGLRRTHEPGESVPFDGASHISDDAHSTGEMVQVHRPGWVLDEGENTHVVEKAKVRVPASPTPEETPAAPAPAYPKLALQGGVEGRHMAPSPRDPHVERVPESDIAALQDAIDKTKENTGNLAHFRDIADHLGWSPERMAYTLTAARLKNRIKWASNEGYDGNRATPEDRAAQLFLMDDAGDPEHLAYAENVSDDPAENR